LKNQKRAGGVFQGEGLEFKPQYWEKKKKKSEAQRVNGVTQLAPCSRSVTDLTGNRVSDKGMEQHLVVTEGFWDMVPVAGCPL
jgi:hypothetical protein